MTLLNQVVVWGSDADGQMSQAPAGYGFADIFPGGPTQSLAIRTDGTLALWGRGGVPPLSFGPAFSFNEVLIGGAIGLTHFVGIRTDRSLVHWGNFFNGQPATPPAGLHAHAVAVGGGHGVAIQLNWELSAPWGSGAGAVPSPTGEFMKVRARSDYTIALRKDGRLYGWGGVFGTPAVLTWDGWGRDAAGFCYVDGPFMDLAASPNASGPLGPHILALHEDGKVDGWGSDNYGQATKDPAGVIFQAIGAGSGYSIGLDAAGRLHHWGNDWHTAQVQDDAPSPARPSRSLAVVPKGRFSAISAGSRHATALRINPLAHENFAEPTVKQPSLER